MGISETPRISVAEKRKRQLPRLVPMTKIKGRTVPAQSPELTKAMTARLWLQQCDAARGIEAQFGVQPALSYLVGEKFLDFLEASDEDATLRADLPTFVAEIKSIFEPWQLAAYLETARETEPFDPSIYDDENRRNGAEVGHSSKCCRPAVGRASQGMVAGGIAKP